MTTLVERMSGIATGSASSKREKSDGRSKGRRVQIDMPPRSMERLEALKEVTEAASYAEVVKNALRLYEAIIEETENGSEILIRRKDDEQPVPYKIFV